VRKNQHISIGVNIMLCLNMHAGSIADNNGKDLRRIEITADYSASYAVANAFVVRRIDQCP
jgi:hypothetical protein